MLRKCHTDSLRWYREMLAGCTLDRIETGEKLAAVQLLPANRRSFREVLIVFHPAGITIAGDLCPGDNAVTSAMGYGRKWFGSAHSPDYLAGKFLQKQFVAEAAAEDLRDAEQWGEHAAECAALAGRIHGLDHGSASLYEALVDIDPELTSDGCPGWAYDPRDFGLLAAIQERYAALAAVPA